MVRFKAEDMQLSVSIQKDDIQETGDNVFGTKCHADGFVSEIKSQRF
jgi:hypothetical protein